MNDTDSDLRDHEVMDRAAFDLGEEGGRACLWRQDRPENVATIQRLARDAHAVIYAVWITKAPLGEGDTNNMLITDARILYESGVDPDEDIVVNAYKHLTRCNRLNRR